MQPFRGCSRETLQGFHESLFSELLLRLALKHDVFEDTFLGVISRRGGFYKKRILGTLAYTQILTCMVMLHEWLIFMVNVGIYLYIYNKPYIECQDSNAISRIPHGFFIGKSHLHSVSIFQLQYIVSHFGFISWFTRFYTSQVGFRRISAINPMSNCHSNRPRVREGKSPASPWTLWSDDRTIFWKLFFYQ